MLYTSLILVLVVALFFLLNHWHQNKGVVYLVLDILVFSLKQTTLLVLNTSRDPLVLASLIAHLDPMHALAGPFIIYYFKTGCCKTSTNWPTTVKITKKMGFWKKFRPQIDQL